MSKLQAPEPVLKRVKDFCYLGTVKASQRLSFAGEETDPKQDGLKLLQVPSANDSSSMSNKLALDSLLFEMYGGGASGGGYTKSTAVTSDQQPPFIMSPKDASNNAIGSTINDGYGSMFMEPQVGVHLLDKSPFMSSDDQIFGTNESLRPEKRGERQRKDKLLLPTDDQCEAMDTWVSRSARAAYK